MKNVVAIAALTLLSSSAFAEWNLNKSASDFSFSSVKKSKVLENHSFNNFSGKIDDAGNATLKLDLTSVNTGIGIRDERMQNMLFETSKFATATFSTQVDTQQLAQLKAGEKTTQEITGKLDLHGVSKELTTKLNIVKLADNKLLVSTAQPVVINAADFALDGGVSALQEIAKLPSISFAVPVSFNLMYSK